MLDGAAPRNQAADLNDCFRVTADEQQMWRAFDQDCVLLVFATLQSNRQKPGGVH